MPPRLSAEHRVAADGQRCEDPSSRASRRSAASSMRPTAFLTARPRVAPRSRSVRKTGCATTITSSRIRSARSVRTCRAKLLPRAAEAGDRPIGRISARLCDRARARRSTRRAVSISQTLIDFVAAYQRVAALDRRDLGVPDHAEARARRGARRLADDVVAGEPQPRGGAPVGSALAEATERTAKSTIASCSATERTGGRLSHRLRRRAPAVAARSAVVGGAGLGGSTRARGAGRHGRGAGAVEHQREATDQLAIGNVITSMRLLSSIDWPPSSIASAPSSGSCVKIRRAPMLEMDFPTRDRYRHSVEELASGSKKPETAVASARWSSRARPSAREPAERPRHHVGYYLISRGRLTLESELGIRRGPRTAVAVRLPSSGARLPGDDRAATRGRDGLLIVRGAARRDAGELWIVGLLVAAARQRARHQPAQLLMTPQIPPRQLPKLDDAQGHSGTDRTFVVVPAIIDSEARVAALFARPRGPVPANRDAHLHFALLTDFTDADHALDSRGRGAPADGARRRSPS